MRRLLDTYQYVAPAVLTPLAGWLWWHHYHGHAALAAIALLALLSASTSALEAVEWMGESRIATLAGASNALTIIP